MIEILKLVSVMLGSAMLGHWFLTEFRKARLRRLPWYAPYLSPPGILLIFALALPVIYWLARR
jgi:hypothetical protein